MDKKRAIKTYDTAKAKTVFVGYLQGDTFTRKVNKRHYMVVERGYGLQDEVIGTLITTECKKIIIKGSRYEYESTLDQWTVRPLRNYGHGFQRFLSVEKMRRIK